MMNMRLWIALVTFERRDERQDILPGWAHGAGGWMVALAPDEETARHLLVRDVEYLGFRVLEVAEEREIFSADEVEKIDEHLAFNFKNIEPGKQIV